MKIGQYLEVLDTPGTLYPKLDDKDKALDLAFIGSIRDEVLDTDELALELIDKLNSLGDYVKARYGVTPGRRQAEGSGSDSRVARVRASRRGI